MSKSPEMQRFIGSVAEALFGATASSCCVCCKEPICLDSFRNEISLKEYRISHMCQQCQDSVFGLD